jgi:pimeloyl-ACP methyl ester carboxylesterase
MTVVFVHGNPETAAVWDLLADRLAEKGYDDQVRLSPPGFGADVPEGFDCTVFAYRDWLIAELEQIGKPVHLVGHDWGGAHVVNVAMARPDLLRSWCTDAIGLFDPDYVWHELAEVWQTPEAGEAALEQMLADAPDGIAGRMAEAGMEPDIAARVAAGFDQAMARSILRLYRSAAQPVMAELGANLGAAAARPGLVIVPTGDPMVGSGEQRQRSAARAGAEVVMLTGAGHWWLTEGGGRSGAAALAGFWASLSHGEL